MDANTRQELSRHLENVANMNREKARTFQIQANATQMSDWKEEYERDADTHRKIAAAFADLADLIGTGGQS